MLSIKNLKLFDTPGEKINGEYSYGDIININGVPGCGKTKLFKILIGVLRPLSGKVIYDGDDIYNSDFLILGVSRKKIGVIFDRPTILSNLTLLDNILLTIRSRNINLAREEIKQMIIQFKLDGCENKRPIDLSKDQILRFNYLKIYICKPRFVFFDDFTVSKEVSVNKLFFDFLKIKNTEIILVIFGEVPKELNSNKVKVINLSVKKALKDAS